jgi:hypothetical protein
MQPVDFKESNLTLRAGNNPNTLGLRVMLARHDSVPNALFYVSKWQLQDDEKAVLKDRIADCLNTMKDGMKTFPELVDSLTECMGEIYLCAMGAPTPVMVLALKPEDFTPADDIASKIKPLPTDN